MAARMHFPESERDIRHAKFDLRKPHVSEHHLTAIKRAYIRRIRAKKGLSFDIPYLERAEAEAADLARGDAGSGERGIDEHHGKESGDEEAPVTQEEVEIFEQKVTDLLEQKHRLFLLLRMIASGEEKADAGSLPGGAGLPSVAMPAAPPPPAAALLSVAVPGARPLNSEAALSGWAATGLPDSPTVQTAVSGTSAGGSPWRPAGAPVPHSRDGARMWQAEHAATLEQSAEPRELASQQPGYQPQLAAGYVEYQQPKRDEQSISMGWRAPERKDRRHATGSGGGGGITSGSSSGSGWRRTERHSSREQPSSAHPLQSVQNAASAAAAAAAARVAAAQDGVGSPRQERRPLFKRERPHDFPLRASDVGDRKRERDRRDRDRDRDRDRRSDRDRVRGRAHDRDQGRERPRQQGGFFRPRRAGDPFQQKGSPSNPPALKKPLDGAAAMDDTSGEPSPMAAAAAAAVAALAQSSPRLAESAPGPSSPTVTAPPSFGATSVPAGLLENPELAAELGLVIPPEHGAEHNSEPSVDGELPAPLLPFLQRALDGADT